MALYESTLIVRQDLSEQDSNELVGNFENIIKEGAGSVVKREYWGLRSFSYKINKNKKGHYYMLGLDAPSSAVHEMERRIRLSEDVLRNLTIKVDKISDEQSFIMSAKDGDK